MKLYSQRWGARVSVITKNRCQIDGERYTGIEARKHLDGVKDDVEKRKVHSLLNFQRSYGLYGVRKKH